jgi:hypothetical protein
LKQDSMHTITRKPDSTATRRLIRRAYQARKDERAFVQSVYALEITPQVEARIEAAKARAEHALNAPFLEQYRGAA